MNLFFDLWTLIRDSLASGRAYLSQNAIQTEPSPSPQTGPKSPAQPTRIGRNTMQTNSQAACSASPSLGAAQTRSAEDLIYQAITIAAALLLLGSLWAF